MTAAGQPKESSQPSDDLQQDSGGNVPGSHNTSEDPSSPIECNDTDDASDDKSDAKKNYEKKRERRFQSRWLEMYPWLMYDEGSRKMYCQYCMRHRPSGPGTFVKGCPTLRLTTLQIHEHSHEHQLAVIAESVGSSEIPLQLSDKEDSDNKQ